MLKHSISALLFTSTVTASPALAGPIADMVPANRSISMGDAGDAPASFYACVIEHNGDVLRRRAQSAAASAASPTGKVNRYVQIVLYSVEGNRYCQHEGRINVRRMLETAGL